MNLDVIAAPHVLLDVVYVFIIDHAASEIVSLLALLLITICNDWLKSFLGFLL